MQMISMINKIKPPTPPTIPAIRPMLVPSGYGLGKGVAGLVVGV